ncbi:hypothetical protein D3C85_1503500 [compost metagenome]
MRHQRFAGSEFRVEGGVVEGKDAFFRGDQLIAHCCDVRWIVIVNRPALGQECRAEHPAVGGEHGHFAFERVARVEQFIPALRRRRDLVRAIANTGRAPGVRHREMVTWVVFQLGCFGIEVFQVGDFDRIDVGQQALLVQDFSEG